MTTLLPCSNCGQLINIDEQICPFCEINLLETLDNQASSSPALNDTSMKEVAVDDKAENVPYIPYPQFAQYLIDRGLIGVEDLNKALEHQKMNGGKSDGNSLGKILVELGFLDQATFNQVILEQILTLQNSFADQLKLQGLPAENHRIENQREPELSSSVSPSSRQLFDVCLRITQLSNIEDILSLANTAIQASPYTSAILLSEPKGMRVYAINNTTSSAEDPSSHDILPNEMLASSSKDLESYFTPSDPVLLVDLNQPTDLSQQDKFPPDFPSELVNILKRWGCVSYALLPVQVDSRLFALLILGTLEGDNFNPETLDPYINLVGFISTSIQKVKANESTTRRLNLLETLDSISKTIPLVTNVDDLYLSIHQQISDSMGDINFMIALYDGETELIEIPYAYEEKQVINIPPFPLGEGLTSIIINTRQPLMLVEDTERRAAELGAKMFGPPAKSWLGVPLIVADDVIGALIIQDLEKEYGFNEDDQRMLTMLSTQVAISIRNAHLLRASQIRAEQERIVAELTNKLWASTNVDTILRTVLKELGQTMKASRGYIQLDIPETTHAVH
jgi:GAF domain-containing protein